MKIKIILQCNQCNRQRELYAMPSGSALKYLVLLLQYLQSTFLFGDGADLYSNTNLACFTAHSRMF